MVFRTPKRKKGEDPAVDVPPIEEPHAAFGPPTLSIIRRGLLNALQRGDIAAQLGFSPEEFEAYISAGASANAPEHLRALAQAVVEDENNLKLELLDIVRTGRNYAGAIWILEHRFANTWGKSARPPAEGVPVNQIDWDAALAELAADPNSPFVMKLRELGFVRAPAPKQLPAPKTS
jgi:hypothetical protein